jgi:hypothetical protein
MSDDLVGVEKRLRELCNDGETLHRAVHINDTDQGAYYIVVRVWDHPEVEDGQVLSERYAYLTKGSGSDGWVDNGVNRRVPPGVDVADMCELLAQGYAKTAAQERAGTTSFEVDNLGGD